MTNRPEDIDMRLLRLHQEIRATREIVEILRKELIKLDKRIIQLEAVSNKTP